jgi:DNA-binding PadR family transcriptional regulator
MIATIVKIDLVGSKSVAASHQLRNPAVRQQLLEKLLEISKNKFPLSDQKYPIGSYYKAEGDAVYFILAKATVALRAAIEFMQSWFNVRLPDFDQCPDCRVMIDRGDIQTVETPAGDDFVSAAFENIAVGEKGLQGGSIYASQDVVENCDKTLARFVSYSSVQPRPGEKIRIYRVEFLDPRTTDDSSLLHALFIAQPKSQAARDRILELFILEYLLEKKTLSEFRDFNNWAVAKSYPALPLDKLKGLCEESTYLNSKTTRDATSYTLTPDGLATLEQAKKDFQRDKERCIETVERTIVKQCGTPKATEQYDLPNIVEEYLCAIFSEIRMMANYFRETSQLFVSEPNELERFDYILRKHLPFTA